MELPLRALIVDDESPARRWLKELLQAHPDIRVTAEADGVSSARQLLLQEQPDIVFLDIQMPPDSGFDLLPYLSAHTRIVFVTAYDNFAVKAFEANALDYLLKPVHPERLAETVSRLLNTETHGSISQNRENGSANRETGSLLQLEDLLPLRDRGVLRMVPVNNVAAIHAEGAYTRIIISGQAPMLVLHAIGDWEKRLPPPFTRLDRSRLLNLGKIREVQTIDRDTTYVSLEQVASPIVLGRSAARRLRGLLKTDWKSAIPR